VHFSLPRVGYLETTQNTAHSASSGRRGIITALSYSLAFASTLGPPSNRAKKCTRGDKSRPCFVHGGPRHEKPGHAALVARGRRDAELVIQPAIHSFRSGAAIAYRGGQLVAQFRGARFYFDGACNRDYE